MSVHWYPSVARQAMEARTQQQQYAILDAIAAGVQVSQHRAFLRPPGSSKRAKVRRKAA